MTVARSGWDLGRSCPSRAARSSANLIPVRTQRGGGTHRSMPFGADGAAPPSPYSSIPALSQSPLAAPSPSLGGCAPSQPLPAHPPVHPFHPPVHPFHPPCSRHLPRSEPGAGVPPTGPCLPAPTERRPPVHTPPSRHFPNHPSLHLLPPWGAALRRSRDRRTLPCTLSTLPAPGTFPGPNPGPVLHPPVHAFRRRRSGAPHPSTSPIPPFPAPSPSLGGCAPSQPRLPAHPPVHPFHPPCSRHLPRSEPGAGVAPAGPCLPAPTERRPPSIHLPHSPIPCTLPIPGGLRSVAATPGAPLPATLRLSSLPAPSPVRTRGRCCTRRPMPSGADEAGPPSISLAMPFAVAAAEPSRRR
jgi:hypothetical protein